jgi:hypothetical protein
LDLTPQAPDTPIVEVGKTLPETRISKKVKKRKTESDEQ